MCRIVLWAFTFVYIAAFALFLIGTFGLFGSEQGPLAGIFLLPIGLPWNLLVNLAPELAWPWLTALAPAINLALLWALCRYLKRKQVN